MTDKKKAAGERRTSPAAAAPISQPVPVPYTPTVPEMPPLGLAIAVVSARYGLPAQWAAIIAVAAGMGGCAR